MKLLSAIVFSAWGKCSRRGFVNRKDMREKQTMPPDACAIAGSICLRRPESLIFEGVDRKGKQISAELQSSQIDLFLCLLKLLYLHLELVASLNKRYQLLLRQGHGLIGLCADIVELCLPVVLTKSSRTAAKDCRDHQSHYCLSQNEMGNYCLIPG